MDFSFIQAHLADHLLTQYDESYLDGRHLLAGVLPGWGTSILNPGRNQTKGFVPL